MPQKPKSITETINEFVEGNNKKNKGRKPTERYSSFDYCYNHFHKFYKENNIQEIANKENMQTSCLQLGFYLASWGMMRGSSFLLEKSSAYYQPLIKEIANMEPEIWEIDVDTYPDTIPKLLETKEKITKVIDQKNKVSDTLITKIMLGVFANTPAFDTFFRKGLEVHTFNEKSLKKINAFYENNKKEINSIKINTYEFMTKKETKIRYTKAKIIDMYGFIQGQTK